MSRSAHKKKSKPKKKTRKANGYLILVSGDEKPEIFEVLAHTMSQCLLIEQLLFEEEPKSHYAQSSDTCPDVLKGKRIIELPNIRSAILSRVIEFCSYHEMKPFHEIKKPFETTDQFTNLVTEFDYNFIDQNHEIIFELVMAANYLDLKSLLDLCMAKLAWMMRVKEPDEICNTFGFEHDFSPLQSYAWAVENSHLENAGKVDAFVRLLEKSGEKEAAENKNNNNNGRKSITQYHEIKLPEERIREESNKIAHAKFLKAKKIQENMPVDNE